MSETVIERYFIQHTADGQGYKRYTALRDVIGDEVRNFARRAFAGARGRQPFPTRETEEFWALKDVSFEVKEGEVVGIIGRNGAGKSTLLKILSRITEPTAGRITSRGRVSSLLEVGTGFHSELTGRENIYLNGAILGMTRAEIRRKFDEIVGFADVEKFLDTPVKRYSSGMYVRLAFAVAAHLEPEILVVDEVLAVGDAEFQQKCLGKMDDVSRREGRTILLVSHNLGVINQLCQKAIWLDRGRLHEEGNPGELINAYLSQRILSHDGIIGLGDLPRKWVAGNELRLKSLEWLSELPLKHGEKLKARILFETRAPVVNLAVGFGFADLTGNRIITYDTDLPDGYRPNLPEPGTYSVEIEINVLPLQPYTYGLDIGCRSGDSYALDYIPSALQLEVLPGAATPSAIAQRASGVRLNANWVWNTVIRCGSSVNGRNLTSIT